MDQFERLAIVMYIMCAGFVLGSAFGVIAQ
jgi:hypothetical protein